MSELANAFSTDSSRDPRIEDPSNLWIIHPLGRALLPIALRMHLSANLVSAIGLLIGGAAAAAYWNWADWRYATLGFVLSIAWLIADGLDGMVARATGTASPFGRVMDGICDHGVFVLLYLALASGLGTASAWILAITAAFAHAVQSSLYEAERRRFHCRRRGEQVRAASTASRNPLVRIYDAIGTLLDAAAAKFDHALAQSRDPAALAAAYGRRAVPAFATLRWLSANTRVIIIYAACLIGDPELFWWFEILLLSGIAAAGITRHRRVEANLVAETMEAQLITEANLARVTERTRRV